MSLVQGKQPGRHERDVCAVVEEQDLEERAGRVLGRAVGSVELRVEEEASHLVVQVAGRGRGWSVMVVRCCRRREAEFEDERACRGGVSEGVDLASWDGQFLA